MVIFDDLCGIEKLAAFGGKAHHEHRADSEVGRDEDRHFGSTRLSIDFFEIVFFQAGRADNRRDAATQHDFDVVAHTGWCREIDCDRSTALTQRDFQIVLNRDAAFAETGENSSILADKMRIDCAA
jgi:hypothetical protein